MYFFSSKSTFHIFYSVLHLVVQFHSLFWCLRFPHKHLISLSLYNYYIISLINYIIYFIPVLFIYFTNSGIILPLFRYFPKVNILMVSFVLSSFVGCNSYIHIFYFIINFSFINLSLLSYPHLRLTSTRLKT